MRYDIWRIAETNRSSRADFEAKGIKPLVSSVLAARDGGVLLSGNPEETLHDPFLLPDMDKAAERVARAVAGREKVAVFGDYDVDGITGVCLMASYFGSKGMDCEWRIPDRLRDGYGLNAGALKDLKNAGVTLVITVDSGVTAIAEAELARELGLDLIITDHHECREKLPDAVAVVNPRRPDSRYPFDGLAGVGVAYKLLQAVEGKAGLPARYSEFAAMGTIADVMPVTGENRVLIKAGLRALGETGILGVKALLRQAGIHERKMNASLVGFALAPRINAAGRMGSADTAVRLLLSREPEEAELLARELCGLNEQRKRMEDKLYAEVLESVEREGDPSAAAIVISGDGWHSGVVGIAASRLAEKLNRPVFLVAFEGDAGKGSARGVEGYDLVKMLENSADLLLNYGGHAYAAGFTVSKEKYGALKLRLQAFSGENEGRVNRVLEIDAVAEPAWIDLENINALSCLEPYGAGNPQPLFMLRAVRLAGLNPMGDGRHIRMKAEAGGCSFGCVWFGMRAAEFPFVPGDRTDIAFRLEINRYRDEDHIQLQLVDIREAEAEKAAWGEMRELFGRFMDGGKLSEKERECLYPSRRELAAVWRYLAGQPAWNEPMELFAKKVCRGADGIGHILKVWVALEVFHELGLIGLDKSNGRYAITVRAPRDKADLSKSVFLRRLNSGV